MTEQQKDKNSTTTITNKDLEEDCYGILKLDLSATKNDISKAYKKLVLIYHPDKNKTDPKAVETFLKIQKAYQILGNDDTRRAFDAMVRVKQMRQQKDAQMDSKKRKMKEDLEEREERAKKQRQEESKAKQNLEKEIERLRKETEQRIRKETEAILNGKTPKTPTEQPKMTSHFMEDKDKTTTADTLKPPQQSKRITKEEHEKFEQETLMLLMQAAQKQKQSNS